MKRTCKHAAHLELLEAAIKQTVYGLCCKWNISFESMVVHEYFEALSKKDRSRITSAGNKQFVCLDDFKSRGSSYISRFATN